MTQINPYIHFNGNAEEAFHFYKSVFGGEFLRVVRFKDMPPNPDHSFGEHEMNRMMHIALPIGDHNVLMGSDVPSFFGQVNENENRSKISISVDTREEADRIYNNLAVGGTIEMPIADSPWGSYFAMFRDKFGIEWMVDCDISQENNG